MEIVWRNPNPINRTSFSIVKTLSLGQPDEQRVFYRSSRGSGALGTLFELLVNVTRSFTRHDPSVNHFGFFFDARTFANTGGQIFHALQATGRNRNRDAKAIVLVRKDVGFAEIEVAVESYPVPA